MGDIVEITTLPVHKNLSFEISGSGLIFYVKSSGNRGAAIGLTKCPDRLCNYWVYIANDSRTWIKNSEEGDHQINTKYTPNLLSDVEYKKFWLSWDCGIICLGKEDNPTPIVSRNIYIDIKHITFCSCENRVHWKFVLPPIINRPSLKDLSRGKPQWVAANDQLPDGSIIGGYENEFLYIIRSPHRGSLTPGKFSPRLGLGFISWGGEAHEKTDFEVLCGFDCQWVSIKNDKIPVTAVEAGYSEGHDSELLYVGRAKHDGHVIPGKVQPSHKVCYIPYMGREISKFEYEILVCPFTNQHASHNLFCLFNPSQVLDTDDDSLE